MHVKSHADPLIYSLNKKNKKQNPLGIIICQV